MWSGQIRPSCPTRDLWPSAPVQIFHGMALILSQYYIHTCMSANMKNGTTWVWSQYYIYRTSQAHTGMFDTMYSSVITRYCTGPGQNVGTGEYCLQFESSLAKSPAIVMWHTIIDCTCTCRQEWNWSYPWMDESENQWCQILYMVG